MTDNNTPSGPLVLYVEDEISTRDQVGRILINHGFQVLMAGNGQEGLELFRRHSPDITITDIMMPVMNGLDMARSIREEAPDAQIVVITAFSDTNYLVEAIDIGINQLIVKPVEINKLLAAIERCIKVVKLEAEALRAKKLEATAILAGGMAHDFNNLLQVILGYISLAKQRSAPGSVVHDLLDVAEKSSGQARELSQRLLTFAKGGDTFMHLAPLGHLITGGVDSVPKGSDVICDFNLPDDIPPVKVDEAQIQQVISHLTVNSLEAMPNGGTLKVTASGCTISELDDLPLPPGEYVHITFRDTGKGIRPENLEKIFDPYFTTKEMGSRKGMGLGLAICQAILRKHNGTITVESKEGQGATFHIYLPVASKEWVPAEFAPTTQ